MTADRNRINADGEDLAYVTLEIIDKDGNLVPDATIPVNVSVNGQGSLLAVATANLKDLEPKTSPRVTTYKGRATIVVRSGKKAGKATITASSPELKGSYRKSINIKTAL